MDVLFRPSTTFTAELNGFSADTSISTPRSIATLHSWKFDARTDDHLKALFYSRGDPGNLLNQL